MDFSRRKIQSRLLALMLAVVTLMSTVNGFTVNLFADAKANSSNTNQVVNTTEDKDVDEDITNMATGDMTLLSSVFNKDENATPVEDFIEMANNDVDASNDIVAAANGAYPSSVDNSKSKYFPEVDSQCSIGSCTTWAEVYYGFTYSRCRALDLPATGENVMSPAFIYNKIKSKNGGSNAGNANILLQEIGTPSKSMADFESYYNEDLCSSWFPEKDIWEAAKENRLTSYSYLTTPLEVSSPNDSSLNEMKEFLNNGYLITFSTNVYGWDFKNIPNGSACSGEMIAIADNYVSSGHRMTIVGYNDNIYYDINGDGKIQDAERGAFKIANSWGKGYWNDGFAWVSYDALNYVSKAGAKPVTGRVRERVFSSLAVQYVEPEATKPSGVNLIMTLNTAARNQMKLTIFAKDKKNLDIAGNKEFTPTVSKNIFSCSLDGKDYATDGTMLLDLNNVVSDVNVDSVNDYYWTVIVEDNESGSPVTVKDLYIEADGKRIQEAIVNNDIVDNDYKYFTLQNADRPLSVRSFEVNDAGPIGLDTYITLTAQADGGSRNYEYDFGTRYEGVDYSLSKGYTDSNSVCTNLASIFGDGMGNYSKFATGNHHLYVNVRDKVSGEVVSEMIYGYQVKPLEISSLKATTTSGEFTVGQPITLSADVNYEAYYRYNTREFSYIYNGVETKLFTMGYSQTFTPTEPGQYTFKYHVKDYMGQDAEKTITVNVVANEAVVYYNNSSWSTAYAHYKVDGGTWTNVPGVKMSASDNSAYKWMITIPLGSANGATICFNNGNNSWDSKNGANYSIKAGKQVIENGTVNKIKMTATANISGEVGNMYADITVNNGTAPYNFEYKFYQDGEYKRTENTTSNRFYLSVYKKGYYKLMVKVTDATGNTCELEKTLDFHGLQINVTPAIAGPQKVGTELKFDVNYVNYYYYKLPYYSYWTVEKDGKLYDFTEKNSSIYFTPQEEGTYTISHIIPDYMGDFVVGSVTYQVVGDSVSTIYYKNSSFKDAYAHFKVDGGSWTNAPGYKMEKSDIEGYDFKYVVDLKGANGVTICFNNGNGSWDSNNGNNYYIKKGTFGVKNSKIEEINTNQEFTAKLSVDRTVGGTNNTTKINVETKNGTAKTYSYYIYKKGENKNYGYGTKNSTFGYYNFTPYIEGTYIIEVEVTDANGNVATDKIDNYVVEGPKFESFTTSATSPQMAGAVITLKSKFVNVQYDRYNSYYFLVSDGTTTEEISSSTSDCGTAVWTPLKPGTYTITAGFRTFAGATYETSMKYEIGGGNSAVVYYKSSWTNAYVHYKVDNENWTNVPGVKMTKSDKAGYDFMYTIDLGSQSGATICFNNGNNSWDSRNGNNYYVGKGTYAVVNGNVVKLS